MMWVYPSIKSIARKLPRFIISTIVSCKAQSVAESCAMAERGYHAIGSEVFVFPLTFVLCMYVTGKIALLWRKM